MNYETPLVSKVSFLDPALTNTVTVAKVEFKFSVATLTPLSNFVNECALSY